MNAFLQRKYSYDNNALFCEVVNILISFISNYFNHHQRFLSQELNKQTKGNYYFIATSEMREERRALGYGESDIPSYVIESHKSEAQKIKANEIVDKSDVTVIGSASDDCIKSRKDASKLVFRYSERIFKQKKSLIDFIRSGIGFRMKNPCGKPVYLLCAGAFVSSDYAKYGLFKNKAYRWGYFPETKYYDDINNVINNKKKNSILWVGRFIDWKHPDDALKAAQRLKEKGYDFELNLIGSGEMKQELEELITKNGLSNCVRILGSMKPEQVREHMEKSEIFLFTSDRREGWGAVLNEAMNSGCSVVASHEIGSVPYLVENESNGIIYESCNTDMLCDKISYLLDNPAKRAEFGKNAYKTISEIWNSSVAAERLINFASHIIAGEKYPDLYASGPCSKAEILNETWFK